MTTAPRSGRRDLALTIITATLGLAATALAVGAAYFMFLL